MQKRLHFAMNELLCISAMPIMRILHPFMRDGKLFKRSLMVWKSMKFTVLMLALQFASHAMKRHGNICNLSLIHISAIYWEFPAFWKIKRSVKLWRLSMECAVAWRRPHVQIRLRRLCRHMQSSTCLLYTSICRAIMASPAVVLADEPTGNLDRKNSEEIVGLLKPVSYTHLDVYKRQ